MAPHADDAQQETDGSAYESRVCVFHAKFAGENHGCRSGESCGCVNMGGEHVGNAREKYIANGASAYTGDAAKHDCYEWRHFAQQRLFCSGDCEERETCRIEHHDDLWRNLL